MAKRSRKTQKTQNTEPRGLVIVTFANDLEQAKNYEILLKANGIPAVIKEQNEQSENTKSIAVMVPENFLDEANVVIESQNAYDDFYDFVLENESDVDFDDELFEDEVK